MIEEKNFIDEGHLEYLVTEDGKKILIADRKVLKKTSEKKYMKWREYNIRQVLTNKEPITYDEFLDVWGIILDASEEEVLKKINRGNPLYVKKKNEFDDFKAEALGNFYFNIYKNLLEIDIAPQYRFRFAYLCCFMNYENMIEWGDAKNENRLAVEKDLAEIWGLGKDELRYTKKALLEKGLISINNDEITINNNYCHKGKTSKKNLKSGGVRMFENGIKELYNSVNSKKHKVLDIFIKILPYVNYTHNIVCRNPTEKDIHKIEPMTMTEICELIGYKTTASAVSMLQKQLLGLKIFKEDAILIVLRGNKRHIYINPRIFYKGNDVKDLKGLINMFDVDKNKE